MAVVASKAGQPSGSPLLRTVVGVALLLCGVAIGVCATLGLGGDSLFRLQPTAWRTSVQSLVTLPARQAARPTPITLTPDNATLPGLVDMPPEFSKVIPSHLRVEGIYKADMAPEPLELAQAKCRALFEEYPKEHQAILKREPGDPKRRIAVFKKGRGTKLETGGVGDFGGGMVGTLLFALLTGRAYELYWPVSYMAFNSPWIVTNYTEDESYLDMPNPPSFGLGSCCNVQVTPDGRAQHVIMLASFGDPHWDFFKSKDVNGSWEGHFSHPVEIFDMNKGMAKFFLADPNSWIYAGLQKYDLGDYGQAFGCGINLLIQLLPEHTAYIQPLARLLRSRGTLSICLHVRTGDQFINQPNRAYCSSESSFVGSRHAFLCAQQLEDRHLEPGVKPVWYLATDNTGLRIFAKSEYPDKLVYYVKPPNREYSQNRADVSRDDACSTSYWWTCMSQVKIDSIVETMEDWHLFSLCDYHVVSSSGFSSSAVGRSMRDGTAYMSGAKVQEVPDSSGNPYGYVGSDGKHYVVDCSQPSPRDQVAGVMGGKW